MADDSRFYPGYFWICEEPDCKLGLRFPGQTAEEAVDNYLASSRKCYWKRGRTVTLYTMCAPDDVPQRHDVTI